MKFTFDLPTYRDKRTVLNMLEKYLICEHPRTPCPQCVNEPSCMFFAYLHREINREAKKQYTHNRASVLESVNGKGGKYPHDRTKRERTVGEKLHSSEH